MKKIISLILSLSVLSLAFAPSASAATITTDTAGEKKIEVLLDDFYSVENGEYKNSMLELSDNGKAVYNIYIPFHTAKIDFKYTLLNSSTNLTVSMNNSTYEKELTDTSATLDIEPNLIKGEYKMVLSVDKPVNISQIVINRTKMLGNLIIGSTDVKLASYETVPDLTDYEKAIQTAVIVSANSPVIMVNGGRRYVNNEDPREVPYVENGEIYLPIHTFSRAFEYYYEQKDDEWVITKDANTFRYKDGVLTRQDYSSEPYQIENITRTVNSKVCFPLGYFAELEGKVLENKDNIYVVEYPSNARAILKDNIFNELSQNYSNWALEEKTGTTYYVSKECKSCDDNDGTERKPFKTIKKAAEVAKAGDTVIIKGGTYYETLTPLNDGTVSNPIVFKAAEGEKVTLSAAANLGSPIGTYTNSYGQELLVYNVLKDLGYGKNQLFYNQENLMAGIHPNESNITPLNPRPENLNPLWGVQGNIKISSTDSSIATSDTDLGQEADFWNGATILAYAGHNAWTLNMARVEKSESGILNLTDPCLRWWRTGTQGGTLDYAWLTSHINTIDKRGEWAIDDGKVYIYPPDGETAETLQLQQKVRQVVIDLSDNRYVRVEGIDTFGGGMKMNNSEMCMLNGGTYEYISHYTYSKDQRDGFIDDGNVYDENGAPPRGEMGIYLGGRDNIIINNTIQYSAAAGIFSVGLYEYIENNAILDCGYMSSYVGGLFIGTQAWDEPTTPRGGNAIYSNTLHRSGRHAYGYSTTEQWYGAGYVDDINKRAIPAFLPSEFAYNDIKDGSLHARDTAPWYQYGLIAGTERLKTRDHHNLVANSWASDGTMNAVAYYDGQTSMFQFYNNVMYWTNDEVDYDTALYRQDAANSQTVTDEWNNSDVGYVEGGKDAIDEEQYPNGKIFASGADWYLKDKTPYINSKQEEFINLSNVEISETAKIENGLFKPSQNGDWICLKDVDFGDGKNKLTLYYSGDYCNTGDKISVIIGDNLEDYDAKTNAEIYTSSPDINAIDSRAIRFNSVSGINNIYLRVDEFKSVNVEKIRLEYADDIMSLVKVGVYADEGTVIYGEHTLNEIPEGETHQIYSQYTGRGIIEYKDVVIPEDCNSLFVRVCGSGDNAGQEMWVTIGSEDGDSIVTFRNNKDSWYDYSVETFKMNKILEAGTYDVYIHFKSESKTSNFLWFGFGNDN